MTKKRSTKITDTRLKCFDYNDETVTSAYEGMIKAKDAMIKILEKEVKDLEVKLHKCQVEAEKQRLKHVDIDDKGKAQKD